MPGIHEVYRAGADRTERRCERPAANLEDIGAAVMTMITMMTAMEGGGEVQPGPKPANRSGLYAEKDTKNES